MGPLGGIPRCISGCYHGVSRQEKQNIGKVLIVVRAEYPGPDGEATKRLRRLDTLDLEQLLISFDTCSGKQ